MAEDAGLGWAWQLMLRGICCPLAQQSLDRGGGLGSGVGYCGPELLAPSPCLQICFQAGFAFFILC